VSQLPVEVIRGGGVLLRPPRPDDTDDLLSAVDDPHIDRYVMSLPSPLTRDDAHRWITSGAGWVIGDPSTGRLLGSVRLYHVSEQDATAEVGYWVAGWARGHGVATAAVTAVTDWAHRRGIARVELLTEPENAASQRVAVRAGFWYEALRRDAGRDRDGTRHDLAAWVRLAGDPPPPSPRRLPDLPGGRLTDGVVLARPLAPGDAGDLLALMSRPESVRTSVPPVVPDAADVRRRCARAAGECRLAAGAGAGRLPAGGLRALPPAGSRWWPGHGGAPLPGHGRRHRRLGIAVRYLPRTSWVGVQRLPAHAISSSASGHHRPPVTAMLPLLAFTGLYVLVYAGEPIKYAYLPIYMNEQLRLAPALSGAVIGIQPLIELVLMPVAVIAARRIGTIRLMTVAAGLGVAANICFATTGTAAGLLLGQTLMGGVWAVFMTLGIIVAQRLLPTAVATASAIFLSSSSLSSAFGGLAGGLGVAAAGLPLVFFIPATLALTATAGLIVMDRVTAQKTLNPTTSR
jgi:RimJ/RimL family protein N-acetyltransferase